MAYPDHHYREMAKWAHQRVDAARRRAEEEKRLILADLTKQSAAQHDNG